MNERKKEIKKERKKEMMESFYNNSLFHWRRVLLPQKRFASFASLAVSLANGRLLQARLSPQHRFKHAEKRCAPF